MRNRILFLWIFFFAQAAAQPKGENYYYTFKQGQTDQDISRTENLKQREVLRKDRSVLIESKVLPLPLQDVKPFLAVSARWYEKEGMEKNTFLYLRFSADGIQFDEWQLLAEDEHFTEGEKHATGLLYYEKEARYFQYRIETNRNGAGITAREVMFNFFNPGKIREDQKLPAGKNSEEEHREENVAACPCYLPPYKSRTEWGCPQGQGRVSGVGTSPAVTHLIVHHSAGSNTSTNWDAVVLSIWNLHVNTNGWSDVGYNWLIAPNGQLYEGRGGGENVIGAHFCGTNSATMGVCMIGTYTSVPVTDTARATLVRILGYKACQSTINPLGQSLHPASGLNLFHISGHRDGCATECPGGNFYATIPALRTEVNHYINSCPPCPPPANPVINATPSTASACQGDSVLLTAAADNCSNCTYSWSNGATTPSVYVKTSGKQTVFMSSSCGRVSQVQTVTIHPSVTPSVQISRTSCNSSAITYSVSASNNGGTAPAYQWYVNDTARGSGNTFTLNNPVNGTRVFCRMTSNAPCASPQTVNSGTDTVNCVVTSVSQLNDVEYIRVMPNPASRQVYLDIQPKRPGVFSFRIADANGKEIYRLAERRIISRSVFRISTEGWLSGTYVVIIYFNNKSISKPLIVL
ncbi:MAG: N-acetylmuramoyl-L-alanine amidase [Chitinophagaceae bacterium]|nr:N-acetylmuramoyl-L-alanine amidase [Chitinophagaceae bacterium]